MNLHGDFEGSFLTNILQLLCDDHNTGILQVRSGRKICKVFFREGAIVYAQSSEQRARLGEMLERDGIISAAQLQDGLESAEQNKNAIGKVLLEKGYISPEIFKQYNNRQVEDILYSLLFWKKGKFDYQDTPLQFDGMVITQLNPMKLILEASRRIDEMSLLTEQIASDRFIYKKVSRKGSGTNEAITFSTDEKRILSLVNGKHTVRDIVNASRYDDFTVYKSLYSLLTSGLIEKVETKKVPANGFDFDFTLGIYTGILEEITSALAAVTDERINLLVRRVKNNLAPAQAELLQDFHISSSPQVNRKAVIDACRKSGSHKMQQSLLLIDSFNGLCHHLLLQIIPMAEESRIYDLISEIDKILEKVKRYPANSVEKNKILSDMGNVLNDAMKQLRLTPAKPKAKRLFSLFGRK